MADKKQEGGIGKALKKYLITGVLVWTPIAVTVWVIGYIISATDQLAALIPAQWNATSASICREPDSLWP